MFSVLDCCVCGAVAGGTTAFTDSVAVADETVVVETVVVEADVVEADVVETAAGTDADPLVPDCAVGIAALVVAGGVTTVAGDVSAGVVPVESICFKLSAFSISSALLSKFSCSISC